jgi:DNA-binding transcriptional regulator YdaS (Cro superfamily)
MITKKEAIQFAGSVTELAKILGISKAAISQWGEIPPQARVWQMQSLHPEWFLFR